MENDRRKKRWAAIGLLALVVALSAVIWRFIGRPMVRLASDPAGFRQWVEINGWRSRLLFMGMVVFQVVIAVIPGEPFEIAAGYAFGFAEGTLLTLTAAAVGSILTFWMVRRFGMKLVRFFFTQEKIDSVKFLKTSQKRDFIFLVVYMLPGTPKDLLGYVAGLTDMPALVYLLVCTFGRIPSVVTSTIGGNALGSRRYGAAALVFLITLAVSGIGLATYNHICARHKAAPVQQEKQEE